MRCFSSEIVISIMAMVMERNATESIDDLVREAESLKTRLEEERAKFNDVERRRHALPLHVILALLLQ